MAKPDSQTLANVTAILMAGSHSDHITVDKVSYYMGIAQSICKQAVAAMPGDAIPADTPVAVEPVPVPAPPAPPAIDIQKLIEESIALAFSKLPAVPPASPTPTP
jgi:hypothetical protein